MNLAVQGLRGWIDAADRTGARGWAEACGADGRPVELDILVAGTTTEPPRALMRVLANGYRRDRDPGRTLHRGRVGFTAGLGGAAVPAHSWFLDVRAVQGRGVPGGPVLVPQVGFGGSGLPADVLAWRSFEPGANVIEVPAGIAVVKLAMPPRVVPGDDRRLGVPVHGLSLDGAAVDLASPGLARGFYGIERPASGGCWRWSGAEAFINLGLSQASRRLVVVTGAGSNRAPGGLGWSMRLAAGVGAGIGARIGGGWAGCAEPGHP